MLNQINIKDGYMRCEICKKMFHIKSGALTRHLKNTHNISVEQYYNDFIGDIEFCEFCNKRKKFNSLNNGYYKTCGSLRCMNAHRLQHRINNPDKYIKSDECKRKISEANKGKKFSKQHKENLSKAMKGRVASSETKKILSEAQKRRYNNPEELKKAKDHLDKIRYLTATKEAKEKRKQTNLKNNGVTNSFHTEKARKNFYNAYDERKDEIVKKIQDTMLKRYGQKCVAHIPEFYEKCTGYLSKKYQFPSGREITIQGYEHFALDILLENYNEEQILTDKKDMPKIWYYHKNKKKRYYCDIYIPHKNLLIEIKSQYYYDFELEKNILKHNTAIELNFNHEIWIINKDGKVENIIK